MQYLEFVKNIMVENAVYTLEDGQGNLVELNVDYRNNRYVVMGAENTNDSSFMLEVDKFAQGLLARKHGVNLARREQYL